MSLDKDTKIENCGILISYVFLASVSYTYIYRLSQCVLFDRKSFGCFLFVFFFVKGKKLFNYIENFHRNNMLFYWTKSVPWYGVRGDNRTDDELNNKLG